MIGIARLQAAKSCGRKNRGIVNQSTCALNEIVLSRTAGEGRPSVESALHQLCVACTGIGRFGASQSMMAGRRAMPLPKTPF